MTLLRNLLSAAVLSAAPLAALAADEPRPSLDEVMQGAVSMTTVANAFLFVAKENEAWVCAINVSSNHFAALIQGNEAMADQTAPSTVCVPASHFKNAME